MWVYDYIIENDIKNPILTKEIKSFFKNSDDEDIFYWLLYSLWRIDKGEYIKIENEFIDNLKWDNKRLDDWILFDQDIISTFIRDTFLDKNDSTYCLDIILTFWIE